MNLEIHPYVGVGPISFGQARAAVLTTLGQPERERQRQGVTELSFGQLIVRLSGPDERVVEVSAGPGTPLTFEGRGAFDDPEFFDTLVAADGGPYESVGFIVLLRLGIALTGFHDEDESQKAVTVFSRGYWDRVIPQMKSFTGRRLSSAGPKADPLRADPSRDHLPKSER